MVIAVASFWMIHDWPDRARFLTSLEKEMVLIRLKAEQGLVSHISIMQEGILANMSQASEGSYNKRIVKKAFKDWKTYCLMLMYIGAAVPLYR